MSHEEATGFVSAAGIPVKEDLPQFWPPVGAVEESCNFELPQSY